MTPEQRKNWMAARTKHGAYLGGKEKPEHAVWRSMLARCDNPNHKYFKHYGGRGIKVCKRWYDYATFIADIGGRPSSAHSLERINTNKGYTPSNCRWATRSEQQRNKTTTKWYTDGAFVGVLTECAGYLGISKHLASWRWKTHGTFEKGKVWRLLKKKPLRTQL